MTNEPGYLKKVIILNLIIIFIDFILVGALRYEGYKLLYIWDFMNKGVDLGGQGIVVYFFVMSIFLTIPVYVDKYLHTPPLNNWKKVLIIFFGVGSAFSWLVLIIFFSLLLLHFYRSVNPRIKT